MIDFHTHILPGIDDGSAGIEESEALLSYLAVQGVDTVALTPHFYPQTTGIMQFLESRDAACERLKPILKNETPQILVGAEVYYYQGISRMADLGQLRLGETKLLMIEMPMKAWSEYMVKELLDISCRGSVRLMLAHIDRYLPMQKPGFLEPLLGQGVLVQANADFFLGGFLQTRRALKMLTDGEIHVLGSDCHNTGSRRPHIGQAVDVIAEKLGDDFTKRFLDRGYHWLHKAAPVRKATAEDDSWNT